jgi:hypothetical protein
MTDIIDAFFVAPGSERQEFCGSIGDNVHDYEPEV